MAGFPKERRIFSRAKTNAAVILGNSTPGRIADLSEQGACFTTADAVTSPELDLRINFPGDNLSVSTNARLVWQRDLADGTSSYGVEFTGLNEKQKAALRQEIIRIQTRSFFDEIKDTQVKEALSQFFLKDMPEYITEMLALIAHLSQRCDDAGEIEKELVHANNQILLKGYCLEELFDNKAISRKQKELFRAMVGTWAYKSPIVKRAFEQPRGYPGDYVMLETIYENQPVAQSGIGLYFDRYFLNNPYAVALRYRKDKLRDMLKEELLTCEEPVIRILDVACGPCREIREIPPETYKQEKKVIFTCLDADDEALEFCRAAVKGCPPQVKFNFIREAFRDIIEGMESLARFGKQDVVYSLGLIDYLPDGALKLFVRFFYTMLKEKGKLILTHRNKEKTFSPLPPDWFCNWSFVPRDKDEVIHLFYESGIKGFSLTVESDDFNDIFYFTLVKL